MTAPTLYLASRSPRRRELLEQIGVPHALLDVEVDESPLDPGEAPHRLAERLARSKAQAGMRALAGSSRVRAAPAPLVLAADTVVVCEGQILGKPRDPADAERMLALLSGRGHQVMTGVALATRSAVEACVSVSDVVFRELAPEERRRYCATGEPLDKAGAYGIQGIAGIFVSELHGSYSGVMGLPLCETAALLARHGVEVLPA